MFYVPVHKLFFSKARNMQLGQDGVTLRKKFHSRKKVLLPRINHSILFQEADHQADTVLIDSLVVTRGKAIPNYGHVSQGNHESCISQMTRLSVLLGVIKLWIDRVARTLQVQVRQKIGTSAFPKWRTPFWTRCVWARRSMVRWVIKRRGRRWYWVTSVIDAVPVHGWPYWRCIAYQWSKIADALWWTNKVLK